MKTFATCDTCRSYPVEVIDGCLVEHRRDCVAGKEPCPASVSRSDDEMPTQAEAHEVNTRQYKAWEAKFRKAHGVEHLGPEALEAFACALEDMLARERAELYAKMGTEPQEQPPAPPEGKGAVIDIEPVKGD